MGLTSDLQEQSNEERKHKVTQPSRKLTGHALLRKQILDKVYDRLGDRFTRKELENVYDSLFRSIKFVQNNNHKPTVHIHIGSFFSLRISKHKLKQQLRYACNEAHKWKQFSAKNYDQRLKAILYYEQLLQHYLTITEHKNYV